jgi:hypothetical protein
MMRSVYARAYWLSTNKRRNNAATRLTCFSVNNSRKYYRIKNPAFSLLDVLLTVDSSGKPLGVTGTDIAFVEDGRIAKLYVILDQS